MEETERERESERIGRYKENLNLRFGVVTAVKCFVVRHLVCWLSDIDTVAGSEE